MRLIEIESAQDLGLLSLIKAMGSMVTVVFSAVIAWLFKLK